MLERKIDPTKRTPSANAKGAIQSDLDAIARLSSVPTILRVISETTQLRLSLVARVTENEWTALAVNDEMRFGLEVGGTLAVATTLCANVRDTRAPVIVEHASQDPEYCDNPIPKMYGFESYIGVPIFLADGRYFGNVCALDRRPAPVKLPRIEAMMTLFAQLISAQLAAEAHQEATRAQLLDAQKTAELREQFIAVLGHDLRNPLSSVSIGAETLLQRALDEGSRKTVERIRASGRRMSRLVSDLLDFARARMGSGIGLSLVEVDDLGPPLRHVVAELESAHPGRRIHLSFDRTAATCCDPERIGQVLSNLLSNAITHGAPDLPVEVRVLQSCEQLLMAVTNQGPPIPAAVIPLLFRPYSRGGRASPSGLGLGLYIASEIARAHGATLTVCSTAGEGTTFTFTLLRSAVARA